MPELQRPTFLAFTLASVSKFGPRPFLYLPREDALGSQWNIVTYDEFGTLIRRATMYWHTHLSGTGVKSGDVVLLRLTGEKYTDLAHTLGICLAGYTAQLVSPTLPQNAEFLYNFMTLSKPKAMLCDPAYESLYSSPPVAFHRLPDLNDIHSPGEHEPFDAPLMLGSTIAMIFHTSGTSSGMPRLVPLSYDWLNNNFGSADQSFLQGSFSGPNVLNNIGTWAHMGAIAVIINVISRGDRVIKPTRPDFPPAELVAMVRNLGLNRLLLYSTFLGHHLRTARDDSEFLHVLQGLRQVLHTGVILQKELVMWAYEHNIPITNLHGSTECGAMLISSLKRGPDALLQYPIVNFTWVPFGSNTSDAEIGTQTQGNTAQYLEVVFPASHPRCPHPSLRGGDPAADYHTGDLFEEVKPGLFEFRGRSDDLIKMRNAMVCNTREIEAHVYATCSDLVSSCIVVGYGRITPALIVEVKDASVDIESTASTASIRQEIIRRIAEFTQQMLVHERITNPALVRVVSPGTLPRAGVKQSISRKAVEKLLAKELDEMYAESVI